jgi:rRNA maturation protein Nop10
MRSCELCGYVTLWRNCPKCISGKTREIDPAIRKAQKEKEWREQERARKARQQIAIASMLKRASEAAKCSK